MGPYLASLVKTQIIILFLETQYIFMVRDMLMIFSDMMWLIIYYYMFYYDFLEMTYDIKYGVRLIPITLYISTNPISFD